MQDTATVIPPARRLDVVALWGGIAFSVLFTVVIWWAGQSLDHTGFITSSDPSWYFWRLPNPTLWSHLTAWGLYLAHQVTIWGLIYYAQKQAPRYTTGLNRFNLLALGANALFILLHFVQTHIWYDGLAQDVSVWSSQVSVIILLVWVLLMENRRRGLFFGKKMPIGKQIIDFARKYHGYYFAWATIYTFWYHPMESTIGHLAGFLYMFLLLLQGSLFFTRVHQNRWWTFVSEIAVLAHGTLVAVYQGNDLWPMFLFGFAGILIITQMHGLRLPRWSKWAIVAVYAGGAALVYSGRLAKLYELVSIPLIEYAGVLVLALIFWAGIKIYGAIHARRRPLNPLPAPE